MDNTSWASGNWKARLELPWFQRLSNSSAKDWFPITAITAIPATSAMARDDGDF